MNQMRIGFEVALRGKLAQKASCFEDERSVLLRSFKHFDTFGYGLVDLKDWIRSIERAGIVLRSPEDLKHLFVQYQSQAKAAGGKLDYRQFADIILLQSGSRPKAGGQTEECKTHSDGTGSDKLRDGLTGRGIRGTVGLAKLLRVLPCLRIKIERRRAAGGRADLATIQGGACRGPAGIGCDRYQRGCKKVRPEGHCEIADVHRLCEGIVFVCTKG